jgi:uncharacterized protein (DUF58 family)
LIRVARAGSGVRIRLRLGSNTGTWLAAVGVCQGNAMISPPSRGIVTEVTAEVTGSAPLGLVTWSRRIRLLLHAPLEVGPVPAAVGLNESAEGVVGSDNVRSQAAPRHDTFKGVRAYTPGDPIRIVHWPATARWGDLMVKEMEDPTAPELTIVVDLRGEHDRSESAASLAAGLARAGLRAGLAVTLLTAERSGPRIGPVGSPLQVGRRLARAIADAPPPDPANGTVIRVSAR